MIVMRPVDIEIMLHYYCRADEWQNGDWNSSQAAWIGNLCSKNLLEPKPDGEPGDNTYRLTERGRVYVQALCTMPLPVCKWVIPDPRDEEAK